jgi:signal transduction histidine kinase
VTGVQTCALPILLRKDGSERWADIAVTLTKLAGVPTTIGIAVDITDRKNMEIELKASHEEMRALAGNLQMAMEAERKRVARMIHDDLAQTLTALQIELSGLTHKLPADHTQLSDQAAAMNRLITMMDERVKHITMELRPPLLDDLGLCAAVKLSLNEFSKRTGIHHEAHYDPEDFALDTDIAIALFRVLQESLTNITRHAEADMVNVHLKKLQDCVSLQIKDNGKGIEKRNLADKKSIGIMGMRERVGFFGGKIRITSPPGGGTTIDVKIPLGQEVTP